MNKIALRECPVFSRHGPLPEGCGFEVVVVLTVNKRVLLLLWTDHDSLTKWRKEARETESLETSWSIGFPTRPTVRKSQSDKTILGVGTVSTRTKQPSRATLHGLCVSDTGGNIPLGLPNMHTTV